MCNSTRIIYVRTYMEMQGWHSMVSCQDQNWRRVDDNFRPLISPLVFRHMFAAVKLLSLSRRPSSLTKMKMTVYKERR